MPVMRLGELASLSEALAATSSRRRKVELLASALRAAGPEDVLIAVPWLSGELRQRRTGIGWATLRDLPDCADVATLTVAETDDVFEAASKAAGPGSATERRAIVARLFGAATAAEQRFLRGLVSGDLRQGSLEGLMVEAVAAAADVPVVAVRRAVMLRGAVAPVAAAALRDGAAGLAGFGLVVGQPLKPMLAGTALSVDAALAALGGAAAVDEPGCWQAEGTAILEEIRSMAKRDLVHP